MWISRAFAPPIRAGTVLLGVCLLATVADVGAQEAVSLRLGGAAGEWYRYSHRNDLVVDLPSDLGGPATTRTTIRLMQRVEDVSADAVHFVTTLEEVSLDVRPEAGELPDLERIQGLQFRHTATRAGRTLSLRLAGGSSQAGPGLMEQVENWLGQLGFPPLPEQSVRVGEEWSETVPVPAMALGLAVDFDVVQTRTVRLTELRSTGGSTVAFLEVATRWEPTADPGGTGGPVISLRGSADQTVRFDVERGRFLGSTGSRMLELVLKPQGGAQYVAVRADGRQLTGLTDSSDGDR
jgi:hypothetical protein